MTEASDQSQTMSAGASALDEPASGKVTTTDNPPVSVHDEFGIHGCDDRGGSQPQQASQSVSAVTCDVAPVNAENVSTTCLQLRELQSQRRAAVQAMQRLKLQQGALMRRACGWSLDLPEKQRAKIAKSAQDAVKAIIKGQEYADAQTASAVEACRVLVLAMEEAVAPLAKQRLLIEKTMLKLAKTLPVRRFVESVNGFGYFGLAIIVGEAGDLGLYANPAKLWKRMGLAVFHGKSQRKTADAEDALLQGYNPKRRSAMWTLGDSLMKAKNAYKTLYDARKIYLSSDEHKAVATVEIKTKMHTHRQAQRYAEKRLLRDLWKAWRVSMKLPDDGGWELKTGVVGHCVGGTPLPAVNGADLTTGVADLSRTDAHPVDVGDAKLQHRGGDYLLHDIHSPGVAASPVHDQGHTSADTQKDRASVEQDNSREQPPFCVPTADGARGRVGQRPKYASEPLNDRGHPASDTQWRDAAVDFSTGDASVAPADSRSPAAVVGARKRRTQTRGVTRAARGAAA